MFANSLIKVLFSLSFFMLLATVANSTEAKFISHTGTIPGSLKTKIYRYTWHKGCPLALKQLSYVQLSYWGTDNKVHQGELIVNQALAKEVVDIFRVLFKHKFPIQRMELMDEYKGDDNLAMEANNTSSFNCLYHIMKEEWQYGPTDFFFNGLSETLIGWIIADDVDGSIG